MSLFVSSSEPPEAYDLSYLPEVHAWNPDLVTSDAKAMYMFVPRTCYTGTPTTFGHMDFGKDHSINQCFAETMQLFQEIYRRLPADEVRDMHERPPRQRPERLFYIKYVYEPQEDYRLLNEWLWAIYFKGQLYDAHGHQVLLNNPELEKESPEFFEEVEASVPVATRLLLQNARLEIDKKQEEVVVHAEKIRERMAAILVACRRRLVAQGGDPRYDECLQNMTPEELSQYYKLKRVLITIIKTILHEDYKISDAEAEAFAAKYGDDSVAIDLASMETDDDADVGDAQQPHYSHSLVRSDLDGEELQEETDVRVQEVVDCMPFNAQRSSAPLKDDNWVGYLVCLISQAHSMEELDAMGEKGLCARLVAESVASQRSSKKHPPGRIISPGGALNSILFANAMRQTDVHRKPVTSGAGVTRVSAADLASGQAGRQRGGAAKPKQLDFVSRLNKEQYLRRCTLHTGYPYHNDLRGLQWSPQGTLEQPYDPNSATEPCNIFTIEAAVAMMYKHHVSYEDGCAGNYRITVPGTNRQMPTFLGNNHHVFRIGDDQVSMLSLCRFHSQSRISLAAEKSARTLNPSGRTPDMLRLCNTAMGLPLQEMDQKTVDQLCHDNSRPVAMPRLQDLGKSNEGDIAKFKLYKSILDISPNKYPYRRLLRNMHLDQFVAAFSVPSEQSAADRAVMDYIRTKQYSGNGSMCMPQAKITSNMSGFADMMIDFGHCAIRFGVPSPEHLILLQTSHYSVTFDGNGFSIFFYGPPATGKTHLLLNYNSHVAIPGTCSATAARTTMEGTGSNHSHHKARIMDEAAHLLTGDNPLGGKGRDSSSESKMIALFKQNLTSADGEMRIMYVTMINGVRTEIEVVCTNKQVYWLVGNIPPILLSPSVSSRLGSFSVLKAQEWYFSLGRKFDPVGKADTDIFIQRCQRNQALCHIVGLLVRERVMAVDDSVAATTMQVILTYLKKRGLHHGDVRQGSGVVNLARVLCVMDAIRIVFDSELSPLVQSAARFEFKHLLLLQPYLSVSLEHLVFAFSMCWEMFQKKPRQVLVEAMRKKYFPGDLSQYIGNNPQNTTYYQVSMNYEEKKSHVEPNQSGRPSHPPPPPSVVNQAASSSSDAPNTDPSLVGVSWNNEQAGDDIFGHFNLSGSAQRPAFGSWSPGEMVSLVIEETRPLLESDPGNDISRSTLFELLRSSMVPLIDSAGAESGGFTHAMGFQGKNLYLARQVLDNNNLTVQQVLKDCLTHWYAEEKTYLLAIRQPGKEFNGWQTVTISKGPPDVSIRLHSDLKTMIQPTLTSSSQISQAVPLDSLAYLPNPHYVSPAIATYMHRQSQYYHSWADPDRILLEQPPLAPPVLVMDHEPFGAALPDFLEEQGIDATYCTWRRLPPVDATARDNSVINLWQSRGEQLVPYSALVKNYNFAAFSAQMEPGLFQLSSRVTDPLSAWSAALPQPESSSGAALALPATRRLAITIDEEQEDEKQMIAYTTTSSSASSSSSSSGPRLGSSMASSSSSCLPSGASSSTVRKRGRPPTTRCTGSRMERFQKRAHVTSADQASLPPSASSSSFVSNYRFQSASSSSSSSSTVTPRLGRLRAIDLYSSDARLAQPVPMDTDGMPSQVSFVSSPDVDQ